MDDVLTIPQVNISEGMIHLGLGQPSNSLLPSKIIRDAAALVLSRESSFFIAYGEEKENSNFRQTLAKYLTDQYEYGLHSDELLITNGNSLALVYTICFSLVLVFLALRVSAKEINNYSK